MHCRSAIACLSCLVSQKSPPTVSGKNCATVGRTKCFQTEFLVLTPPVHRETWCSGLFPKKFQANMTSSPVKRYTTPWHSAAAAAATCRKLSDRHCIVVGLQGPEHASWQNSSVPRRGVRCRCRKCRPSSLGSPGAKLSLWVWGLRVQFSKQLGSEDSLPRGVARLVGRKEES